MNRKILLSLILSAFVFVADAEGNKDKAKSSKTTKSVKVKTKNKSDDADDKKKEDKKSDDKKDDSKKTEDHKKKASKNVSDKKEDDKKADDKKTEDKKDEPTSWFGKAAAAAKSAATSAAASAKKLADDSGLTAKATKFVGDHASDVLNQAKSKGEELVGKITGNNKKQPVSAADEKLLKKAQGALNAVESKISDSADIDVVNKIVTNLDNMKDTAESADINSKIDALAAQAQAAVDAYQEEDSDSTYDV